MATIGSYAQQLSLINRLNMNYAAANKNMEHIATGNKINSPADDASGYSIGKRMDIEANSLEQCMANVQNGKSMMNVADGAMSNTLDILTTLKEKAIAAANSTANDKDRAAIQQEINQYIDQIDDNSLVTFNGMYLLTGSASAATKETNQAFTNKSLAEDVTGATKLTDLTDRVGNTLNISENDTIHVSYVRDGKTYHTSYSAADTTLADIFKNANNAGGGEVFDTSSMDTATNFIGIDENGKELYTVDDKNAITIKAAQAGKNGGLAGFTISVTDSDGNERKAINSVLDAFSETIGAADNTGDGSLAIHTGTSANQNIKLSLKDMSAIGLGLKGRDGSFLSVGTRENAEAAINVIQNAIDKILAQQTTTGAINSRMDYTYKNLTTQNENVVSAMTTLISADIAKEITQFTTNNMLAQATQAMLAQSYQNSSWFLNLLG